MRPDEHAASTLGPVQVMVIGFEGHDFTGEILPELRRLEEQDIVSLVDLLFVEKDDDGEVRTVELSGLSAEERAEFGAIAGALAGLGAAGAEGLEAGRSQALWRWGTEHSTRRTSARDCRRDSLRILGGGRSARTPLGQTSQRRSCKSGRGRACRGVDTSARSRCRRIRDLLEQCVTDESASIEGQ